MALYDWGTFGFHIPKIMVPKEGTDYSKWAVVACDQFTSQPDYWEKAEEIVGDAPSTLRLMLPEIFLDKPGEADKIKAIRAAMDQYMADGTLRTLPEGCMLVKRTAEGRTRLGLVIATDLESYDFNKGSIRQEYWSGLHALLQGIFLTQESNQGLLHCRRILYQLSYQRSP